MALRKLRTVAPAHASRRRDPMLSMLEGEVSMDSRLRGNDGFARE
jgi:hypothetical protein